MKIIQVYEKQFIINIYLMCRTYSTYRKKSEKKTIKQKSVEYNSNEYRRDATDATPSGNGFARCSPVPLPLSHYLLGSRSPHHAVLRLTDITRHTATPPHRLTRRVAVLSRSWCSPLEIVRCQFECHGASFRPDYVIIYISSVKSSLFFSLL